MGMYVITPAHPPVTTVPQWGQKSAEPQPVQTCAYIPRYADAAGSRSSPFAPGNTAILAGCCCTPCMSLEYSPVCGTSAPTVLLVERALEIDVASQWDAPAFDDARCLTASTSFASAAGSSCGCSAISFLSSCTASCTASLRPKTTICVSSMLSVTPWLWATACKAEVAKVRMSVDTASSVQSLASSSNNLSATAVLSSGPNTRTSCWERSMWIRQPDSCCS
mmetsp:Transcript_52052/g.123942  ORF Transcript_52052/g.123942 Transcript_52052/m.123942 type:complete len:222 (-) Transcript_52052:441-1106(-)